MCFQELMFGENVSNYLEKCKHDKLLTDTEIRDCLVNCRIILITACESLNKKFDYEQEWFAHLKFFHPENALSAKFHQAHWSIQDVFDSLPFLRKYNLHEKAQMDSEWNKLCSYELPEDIRDEGMPSDKFWIKMKKCM